MWFIDIKTLCVIFILKEKMTMFCHLILFICLLFNSSRGHTSHFQNLIITRAGVGLLEETRYLKIIVIPSNART